MVALPRKPQRASMAKRQPSRMAWSLINGDDGDYSLAVYYAVGQWSAPQYKNSDRLAARMVDPVSVEPILHRRDSTATVKTMHPFPVHGKLLFMTSYHLACPCKRAHRMNIVE